MTESEIKQSIEVEKATVDQWIDALDDVARGKRELEVIEPKLLRRVLEHYGADFEDLGDPERIEKLAKIKQSTNKYRREGMNAVWGEEYINNFYKWCTQWANTYEAMTSKDLPRIAGTGTRQSGMLHMFGEMTAYASGERDWEYYSTRLKTRLRNGWNRAHGMPRSEIEKVGWLADEKEYPGSIPPTYPQDMWALVTSKSFTEEVPEVIIPPLLG